MTHATLSPSLLEKPSLQDPEQGHKMIAYRFPLSSTHRHANALAELLQAPDAKSVRFFATSSDALTAQQSDGSETNFPLLAALVDYSVPGLGTVISIVFDGVFLTARRSPRSAEISDVLNAAIKDGRVVFGTEAVPFTSSLPPEEAIAALMRVPTARLTEESRPTFWSMLSVVPEQDH